MIEVIDRACDAAELVGLTWAWLWFANKAGVADAIRGFLRALFSG